MIPRIRLLKRQIAETLLSAYPLDQPAIKNNFNSSVYYHMLSTFPLFRIFKQLFDTRYSRRNGREDLI